MKIEITNAVLYAQVLNVDICLTQRAFSNTFVGSVVIDTEENKDTFIGEHSASQYEKEYGFRIINN